MLLLIRQFVIGQFLIEQFNKPITFEVVVEVTNAFFASLLMQIFPFFHYLAILLFSEIETFMIN